MLSMGPFDLLERLAGNARDGGKGGARAARRELNIPGALRGAKPFDVSAFARKSPQAAIASVRGEFQPRELEFTMFDGEPVYLATDGGGATRIIPVNGGAKPEFDRARIMDIVRAA